MFYTNIPNFYNSCEELQVDLETAFQSLFYDRPIPQQQPQNKKLYITTKCYQTLDQIPGTSRNLHQTKAAFFERAYGALLASYANVDMSAFYTTFQIPKHSGGMRTIQAPNEEIKQQMQNMLMLFQNFLYPNQAAFAYVKHRTIKDAIEEHQSKQFKWFLHLDLHDFFGSCNPTFIKEQLRKTPFFAYWPEELMSNFLHYCMLDNSLPQGTPLSPFITNMIMGTFDQKTRIQCVQHNGCYTRYADDMLISSTSKTALEHMKNIVLQNLRETPFQLNEEKTKVSSIYGKNWNLGLMLNKDQNITVGYKNKERIRATLNDFCRNTQQWESQGAMELLGKLQYFISIEPEYFQNLLTKYGEKFNIDIRQTIIRKIKE